MEVTRLNKTCDKFPDLSLLLEKADNRADKQNVSTTDAHKYINM